MWVRPRDDDRFDTLFKRINFFREENETTEQLAARLGVTVADLESWRRPDTGLESVNFEALKRAARALDVNIQWLAGVSGHYVIINPDGQRRLTTIERYLPWHEFTDTVETDEPRQTPRQLNVR